MKINDFFYEEKTRLDPACWTGKKIGTPKTKVKGGVRVNNCVPAESVAEGSRRMKTYNDGIEDSIDLLKTLSGNSIEYIIDRLQDYQYANEQDQLRGKLKTSDEQGVAEGSEQEYKIYFVIPEHEDYPDRHEPTEQTIVLANSPGEAARKFKAETPEAYIKDIIPLGQPGVAEGSGEYDDEAGMADNNLETLRRAVDGIDNVINTGDNLPEWCQEKIAVAKSMLVTVWDYMRSEEQIEDPEIAEMYEAMQLMAESMAHKHRVSVDLVWESFEALDDHMLYETAAWRRKEGKSAKGGLNAKGVASYRRENPGSKLQTAVTTKPSKLKPGSKAAKRRKSFCARMSGVKGPAKKPNGKPTRKTLALRKWNC